MLAKCRQEGGGQQHQSHMAPAVKGMEQAHGRFFILKGTGLHNRAAEHFDQSASDRIQDYAAKNSHKRIRQEIRQKRQSDEPGGGTRLGGHNTYTISNPVHEFGTKQIHQKLCKEKQVDISAIFPREIL